MLRVHSILISGFGALLIGAGLGFLFIGSSYSFAIFLCIIWTLGEILFFSTLQAVVYEKAHLTRKGAHMGIMQMVVALANIIGPISGGWLYNFNTGKWLWLSCFLMRIIAFLAHYKIYLNENRQERLVWQK